jgi:collagenase-like PrtC family protease
MEELPQIGISTLKISGTEKNIERLAQIIRNKYPILIDSGLKKSDGESYHRYLTVFVEEAD